jgi:TatD DNase family protein
VYANEGVLQSEDWPGGIDTHCHLDLEPLYQNVAQVVVAAHRAGITGFVVPGVHPEGWRRIETLAREFPGLYAAFGIHPMHAAVADAVARARLAELAGTGVAIGETGLDPAYDVSLELQEAAFRAQIRIALDQGLPLLVHCRRVFQRTLQVLREEGAQQVGGIMHAYSGSLEMAREFIRLGFVISISGMITRENTVRLPRLVQELSLDELVLETDAPDMTPHRFRGQPNQPAWLTEVVFAVAQLKGLRPVEVVRACRDTSVRVLSGIAVR